MPSSVFSTLAAWNVLTEFLQIGCYDDLCLVGKMSKAKKNIPYDFVLEQLHRANPVTKPMFGSHAVYVYNKIVFILRQKESATEDNGVWVATTADHHESLRKEFPSLKSIGVFGGGETGWQVLPEDADDFEESVINACALVLQRDVRIGKIPKPKKKKKD